MKKSDFWNRIYIPITKRVPENERGIYVLVWAETLDEPIIMESYIAYSTANSLLAKEPVSPDRVFRFWLEVKKPKRKRK